MNYVNKTFSVGPSKSFNLRPGTTAWERHVMCDGPECPKCRPENVPYEPTSEDLENFRKLMIERPNELATYIEPLFTQVDFGQEHQCRGLLVQTRAAQYVALKKCDCCERGDEYNGFASDGPTIFTCPKICYCHD